MTTPADIPNCDYCGQVQATSGGLVFSPPDDGGFVRKYHVCTDCFIDRFIPAAAGFDIVARQPDTCPTCGSDDPDWTIADGVRGCKPYHRDPWHDRGQR